VLAVGEFLLFLLLVMLVVDFRLVAAAVGATTDALLLLPSLYLLPEMVCTVALGLARRGLAKGDVMTRSPSGTVIPCTRPSGKMDQSSTTVIPAIKAVRDVDVMAVTGAADVVGLVIIVVVDFVAIVTDVGRSVGIAENRLVWGKTKALTRVVVVMDGVEDEEVANSNMAAKTVVLVFFRVYMLWLLLL
jgi:hypothetical protein